MLKYIQTKLEALTHKECLQQAGIVSLPAKVGFITLPTQVQSSLTGQIPLQRVPKPTHVTRPVPSQKCGQNGLCRKETIQEDEKLFHRFHSLSRSTRGWS